MFVVKFLMRKRHQKTICSEHGDVADAHMKTLEVITRILRWHEDLTGLKINRQKTTFVPIVIPTDLVPVIKQTVGCDPLELPLKYLCLASYSEETDENTLLASHYGSTKKNVRMEI